MTILVLIFCILLLIALITWAKVNAFLAFLIVALLAGCFFGMPFTTVIASVNKGLGDTLGSVAIIIVLGAMLGKLVAESGAAQRIAHFMHGLFGAKYVTYAMAITGFIVGIPLYYNVGFILLVPIIFSVASSYRLPLLYVGMPMLTALSVMHGFLPPHPSPMTLISVFHADVVKTFGYGLIIAIPAIIIAGPVFSTTLKKIGPNGLQFAGSSAALPANELPGIINSILSSLLPVVLICLAHLPSVFFGQVPFIKNLASWFAEPVIAMLLTLIISTYTLGLHKGRPLAKIMDSYVCAVKDIAMVLIIIGSAGALKQIFVDSHLGDVLAGMLVNSTMHPLLFAWLATACLRLCLGSATVAGVTAAGVLFPIAHHSGVNTNLLVLAIGAGSLFGSHVNDTAFWLCKEYFGLSVKETLRSWTVMESLVSVIGLAGVLSLDYLL
ncbi:gluconate:H+ symporter [Mucilaginibacter pocheonensis]|uniref:Gnt-I system high-affinity gluconate transporter n=1 Tax=Mucilaginibacter pocheonensis TaxID=398050 RepID=A0ABU1TEM8_9SPHI|nr:gluconate:H+ symporter [Mucilaginibacter pocheonensis]MDR6943851.1 Gnt-I system high-affinity gluconate transporter [Mucilaginibacter pocheonensis]